MATATLVVLEGDQTGEELLLEALRVLEPSVIHLDLAFERYDLSLENRRATKNDVVLRAADAMRRHKLGLRPQRSRPKAATTSVPPIAFFAKPSAAKSSCGRGANCRAFVRSPESTHRSPSCAWPSAMRTARKSGAKGEGFDEIACRTETISRSVCRYVAEYAFVHAEKMDGTVFGGPKYTVSPVYEGMLKEEMDAAALRHPGVPYDPQLIDATYALLLSSAGDSPLIIPSLNRDGDCLSDFVMQLFGSIAGAESLLLAFDESLRPSVVMAEAPHGTAPRLQGKDVANPLAMILAAAAHSPISTIRALSPHRARSTIRVRSLREGIATADLGGPATTTEFTNAMIARVML